MVEILRDAQIEMKKVDLRRLVTERDSSEDGTPVLRPKKQETAELMLNCDHMLSSIYADNVAASYQITPPQSVGSKIKLKKNFYSQNWCPKQKLAIKKNKNQVFQIS